MSDINSNFIGLWITVTLLGVVFIFFLIAALVRLRNNQNKKKRELLKALIEERERTMYTISTEIHDNVNQELNLVRMTLRVVERQATGNQANHLKEMGIMLDNVIEELRNIGHTLNSDYVKKKGIYDFLETELNRINITKRLSCHLEVAGFTRSFHQDTELIVVRIAQEAIQNSLKHAKAKNLTVYLTYSAKLFEMQIKDDGYGFQIDKKSDGIGIQSIYNRSKIINGALKINSGDDGTEVILAIPDPKYINIPIAPIINDKIFGA